MENIFETIKRRPIHSFIVATFGILASGSIFVIIMYGVLHIVGGNFGDFAETTRNFAWLFWMILSLVGAGLGLSLAWWGRQIQQDTNDRERLEILQERFEKATTMLNSEAEWMRVGACLTLADLGRADASMKSQCVYLLFAFINKPPLRIDEQDKDLDELFPADKPLRPDIQEAIASFSAIYEYYGEIGIDNKPVELPNYFWVNEHKGRVSLIKVNLEQAQLKKAYLRQINFEKANLRNADLSDAELQEAKLLKSELGGANLERAKLKGATLLKANLFEANFSGANLEEANLQGANLRGINFVAYVDVGEIFITNFREACLQEADLQDADISSADIKEAKNLTKEQILSAKWGYGFTFRCCTEQPQLPESLIQDKDIKRWLETPAYDERKKFEEFRKKHKRSFDS